MAGSHQTDSRGRFRIRWRAVLAAGLAAGAAAGVAGAEDPAAQYRAGMASLYALGEDRRIRDGVEQIIASADAGYAPALTRLADLHTKGLGVPYAPATALRLLLTAAADNHPAAAWRLGECHRKGIGTPPDPARADAWFARAVTSEPASGEAFDGESLLSIGLCHRDGDGVPPSYAEAARFFVEAARDGTPRALFELAEFYAHGLGVAADPAKALALYLRAAHLGYPRACLAVSRCYQDGTGIDADPNKARTWAEHARDQLAGEARFGSLEAAVELYCQFSRGAINADPAQAVTGLIRAAEAGYAPALTLYGEALATGAHGIGRDPPAAIAILERAAEAYEPGAHYLLAQFYMGGADSPPDPDRAWTHLEAAARLGHVAAMGKLADWHAAHPEQPAAADWQQRALAANRVLAERGHIPAQLVLVSAYGRGAGVPRDEAKALAWMRTAAESGWAEARFSYANACEKGLGVPRDPEQALRWYRAAAEQDFVPAMLRLAEVCAAGELGGPADPAEAARWQERAWAVTVSAAEAGDPDAAVLAATFHREGIGCARDLDASLRWLHRAAELRNPQACLQLGSRYSTGRTLPRDPDKAFAMIRQAAEAGAPEGRFLLGRLYDEGQRVARDPERAYELYYAAARQGYRPARELQEEMEVTLDPRMVRRARARADAALRRERLAAGDITALDGPPAPGPGGD